MKTLYASRIDFLRQPGNLELLTQGLQGIERESLRVDQAGRLALTEHPRALGSALTHPLITTDYSEALIELITGASHDFATVHMELETIHRFVAQNISDEMLWSQSMPCLLPGEAEIPIAWYGTSHIGMLKHVYRRGLALRYGKSMQCIAGIHYNFSLNEELWKRLQQHENMPGTAQQYQSESYVALIRNFRRYGWLLMYLFGASPAVSKSFAIPESFPLESLSDDTAYLPFATSLRMSDMGYQNDSQSGLMPDYNSLEFYIDSLSQAVSESYPAYDRIGTHQNGEWVQLNTNRLQIENEYYSPIRPKRITQSGERPLQALAQRGIQYIEARCIDVDPYEAVGISETTGHFLNAFLHYCAIHESPLTERLEGAENSFNFGAVVKEGRRPGLMLKRSGKQLPLKSWGMDLLEDILAVGEVIDAARGDSIVTDAIHAQRRKLEDIDQTPSAAVMRSLAEHNHSYHAFACEQTRRHMQALRATPMNADVLDEFTSRARSSLDAQEALERNCAGSFDQFVVDYCNPPTATAPRPVETTLASLNA